MIGKILSFEMNNGMRNHEGNHKQLHWFSSFFILIPRKKIFEWSPIWMPIQLLPKKVLLHANF